MDQEDKSMRRSTTLTHENKFWKLEPNMNPSKYEIKGTVVPLGAGLRTSGYVVLQDGQYREFFKTRAEAEQAAQTWTSNEEEKECCE